MPGSKAAFPEGHFYSPIVDVADVASRRDQLWPAKPAILGIDFNDDYHRRILTEAFPRWIGGYDYPEEGREDEALDRFYTRNSQFSWLDSRLLFVMLRELQPRRIVEVGSGYSSLLMADVNRRFFDGGIDITCIEPYPRAFLQRPFPGIRRVIRDKVQALPSAVFEPLESGDILFIDSSHVSKTGSDVNHLYFEILPRLAPGVVIHAHDIFFPHEYPQDWAIGENRSWNEQYLLRALLMYSTAFRFLVGSNYAFSTFPDLVAKALALPAGRAFGGASVWIERLPVRP
jgi:predicted O-methyltransferase YrrM